MQERPIRFVDPEVDGVEARRSGHADVHSGAARRVGFAYERPSPRRSMILEHRTVSRKTPKDGMLEISAPTADRLGAACDQLAIEVNGSRGTGRLMELACGCARGDGQHVHQFLASELLRSLTPDARVLLELDEDERVVHVTEQR